MDFYRADIDSDTAWPTFRGTPNPIINLDPTPLLGYTNTDTVNFKQLKTFLL